MVSKNKAASGYGEADIEAKAMSKAAAKPGRQRGKPVPSTRPDTERPAEGTTETDLAANIRDKTARSSKN